MSTSSPLSKTIESCRYENFSYSSNNYRKILPELIELVGVLQTGMGGGELRTGGRGAFKRVGAYNRGYG